MTAQRITNTPSALGCEEQVMHRWGWGYMRPCLRKNVRVCDDGKRRCTYHANKRDARIAEDIYRNTVARVFHGDPTP
jgi:hypothetical protein